MRTGDMPADRFRDRLRCSKCGGRARLQDIARRNCWTPSVWIACSRVPLAPSSSELRRSCWADRFSLSGARR
jgi:hypothetical protein